ncbi:5-formyltetrahydrofolate cyclo-ligase [Neorickettsia sp. 179522]|uniref:5-formyltetrahydrofolate cyclo-ligase n=1 Tax=Neorickettsia sp. 179522 TaxID=1714371 RepID=UPI0007928A23|nr:5-formyltetrahydrofolate cyclo-ligase [Neorickettsia sp. 179522]KYH12295.1 5-formyltetrahydrofolate cyclo-ligase [Neorickettsia sp. 179522]
MIEDKARLREKYRKIRKSIANRELIDRLTVENLLKTLDFKHYKTIGLYLPIDGEVDPTPLLDELDDKVFSLPCILSNQGMCFRTWKKGDILVKHDKLNIRYPAGDESIIPELVFVPLVAFNCDRHRLGFGMGFFDRFISHSRSNGDNTLYVGLAYDKQLCHDLVIEAHDQALDSIVTSTTVY